MRSSVWVLIHYITDPHIEEKFRHKDRCMQKNNDVETCRRKTWRDRQGLKGKSRKPKGCKPPLDARKRERRFYLES